MKHIPCATAFLAAMTFLLVASGCSVTNPFQKSTLSGPAANAPDAQRGNRRGDHPGNQNNARQAPPRHFEQDPVDPQDKSSHGIDYDPGVFESGAYRPDSFENMIASRGFDGLAQHTFAEAGGDFDVDVDPTGQYMVFSTTRYGKNPDICVQSVTGRSVSLRTSDGASDMMPKFSPDGKSIAWCSNRYGTWDVLMTGVTGSPDNRPQVLANSTEDEISPTWSHDSKLLAFSRYSAMDGVWNIWTLDLATRTLSCITQGLFAEFAPVMMQEPDGTPVYALAYQKHRKRDVPWFSVWVIRVKMGRGGAVELAGAPMEVVSSNDWAAINPAWSPDGKYLAFASVRKSPLAQMEARIYRADDIWVVRTDGTDLTQITSHAAPDWNPCWAREKDSPVGRLYFSSLRNGHPNVWSVKPMIPGMMAE